MTRALVLSVTAAVVLVVLALLVPTSCSGTAIGYDAGRDPNRYTCDSLLVEAVTRAGPDEPGTTPSLTGMDVARTRAQSRAFAIVGVVALVGGLASRFVRDRPDDDTEHAGPRPH